MITDHRLFGRSDVSKRERCIPSARVDSEASQMGLLI
jgi:hypothetical protein